MPNSDNAGNNSTASFYGSVGWYRRDFLAPKGPAGEQWVVRFESVNYDAEVWLNGHLIGSHVGSFLPFELDLKGLRTKGVNRLIVRVDNELGPGDLPAGPYGTTGTPAVGGWWNYGGILGDVYLRPVQEANLEQVIVRPELPCPTCAATIDEQALVHNVETTPQRVRLRGSFGGLPIDFGTATIAPGATWTAHADLRIADPRISRAHLILRFDHAAYLSLRMNDVLPLIHSKRGEREVLQQDERQQSHSAQSGHMAHVLHGQRGKTAQVQDGDKIHRGEVVSAIHAQGKVASKTTDACESHPRQEIQFQIGSKNLL